MFEYKYKVKFHDVDAAGIIFYANVFKIAHDAYQEMLYSFNLDEDYFTSKNFAIPIVHTEADYLKPICFGDELNIQIKTVKIGNSSFILEYDFIDQDFEKKVKVNTTHVFITKDFIKKVDLPELIKSKLKSL